MTRQIRRNDEDRLRELERQLTDKTVKIPMADLYALDRERERRGADVQATTVDELDQALRTMVRKAVPKTRRLVSYLGSIRWLCTLNSRSCFSGFFDNKDQVRYVVTIVRHERLGDEDQRTYAWHHRGPRITVGFGIVTDAAYAALKARHPDHAGLQGGTWHGSPAEVWDAFKPVDLPEGGHLIQDEDEVQRWARTVAPDRVTVKVPMTETWARHKSYRDRSRISRINPPEESPEELFARELESEGTPSAQIRWQLKRVFGDTQEVQRVSREVTLREPETGLADLTGRERVAGGGGDEEQGRMLANPESAPKLVREFLNDGDPQTLLKLAADLRRRKLPVPPEVVEHARELVKETTKARDTDQVYTSALRKERMEPWQEPLNALSFALLEARQIPRPRWLRAELPDAPGHQDLLTERLLDYGEEVRHNVHHPYDSAATILERGYLRSHDLRDVRKGEAVTTECFVYLSGIGHDDSLGVANLRAFEQSGFTGIEGVLTRRLYGGTEVYLWLGLAEALDRTWLDAEWSPEEAAQAELIGNMIDTLERLENYPLISDDVHSEVEREHEDEAWSSWLASDFKRALEREFKGLNFDDVELSDPALFELFYQAMTDSNTYWIHESGGATVELRRVIEVIDEDQVRAVPGVQDEPSHD